MPDLYSDTEQPYDTDQTSGEDPSLDIDWDSRACPTCGTDFTSDTVSILTSQWPDEIALHDTTSCEHVHCVWVHTRKLGHLESVDEDM